MNVRCAVAAVLAVVIAASVSAEDMVYVMENDYVVVEAEDLAYSTTYWQKRTSPSGYTGSGWLKVIKGGRGGEDPCHNEAKETSCLTDPSGWLKIPVYIDDVRGEYGGIFGMDVHAYHDHDGDGSNDLWVGVEGYPDIINREIYAFREGRSHKGYGWCWGAMTPERLEQMNYWAFFVLKESAKVYTFFVSPRSNGFSADRVAIYFARKTSSAPGRTNLSLPAEPWKLSTPVSRKVSLSQATGTANPVRMNSKHAHEVRFEGLGANRFRVAGLRTGDLVTATNARGRAQRTVVSNGVLDLNGRAATGICVVKVVRNGVPLAAHRLPAGF